MKYLTRTEDSLRAAVINEWSWVSCFILLKAAIIAIGTRQIKREWISTYLWIHNRTIDCYKILWKSESTDSKNYREKKKNKNKEDKIGKIGDEQSCFHSSNINIYKDMGMRKWENK